MYSLIISYFGTIQNNTALKHELRNKNLNRNFGTIQNNTALKHNVYFAIGMFHFGTIQNNTALKLVRVEFAEWTQFWNHSEQHSSKTHVPIHQIYHLFWNHSEQHSSKTCEWTEDVKKRFWNHSEQHSSKTSHFKIIALFRNRTIRLS